MKKMVSIALVVLVTFGINALPVQAQGNFVEQFLSRYRPTPVNLPNVPSPTAAQVLASRIQNGLLPLTASDVIQLMLENNLDISVNRLNPLSAQYLIETFYRPFEPTLRLSATIDRNTSPSTSQLTGAPSLSLLTGSYTVGYLQTLPTGTDVSVDFTLNRNSSNNAFSTFNPSWVGGLRYTFSQHLLRDYGRSVNERQIRVARNNEKISETQFELQLINLVSQAQRSYWDLVFAGEDVKVKQRSVDLAQKTLNDNQIQVQIGTLAPIDLVQAESELANRSEQKVVSVFTQAQTGDEIKKLITWQQDPGLVLATLNPSQGVRQPGLLDVPPAAEAIKIALENRPEMRQLQLDLENRNIDVEYTRNQLLPSIDVIATYNQNGVGGIETLRNGFGPTAPIVSVTRGGLGDTFGQLFGYNYTGYSAGISVSIPLRNKGARGDNARALTEKRISENRLNAQAQQIALEVRNAITQVEMNRARIETAQKARELSERRLEAEQKKFDLGASTIRFVLEEQRNVAQSQTNEIQALVNYTKALVDADRAMGMTLKKNNIQLEKSLPTIALK